MTAGAMRERITSCDPTAHKNARQPSEDSAAERFRSWLFVAR